MASNLFNRALSAAARITQRATSKVTPQATPNVVRSVLHSLGPIGRLIERAVSGPSNEIRRESEANAARQIVHALNRQGYDRNLRTADALLRHPEAPPLDDVPIPPPIAPRPAPSAPPVPQTQPQRTPPQQPPAPPGSAPASGGEQFDRIQLLGRGAFYYEEDIRDLIGREHLTPGSSNVYSFVYENELPNTGILYVTFRAWHPGQRGKSNSPGPTYAYYNVPLTAYRSFLADADVSAGRAVWDYLRVRGTVYDHRYPYRIVAGSTIPSGGVYVPRKATRLGFKNRSVAFFGVGRRDAHRSSLPEQNFLPNRGTPDRGEPDRGRP